VSNSNIQTILNCPFLPQSLVAPADEASQDFDALALTLTQAQADNAQLQSQVAVLQAQIAADQQQELADATTIQGLKDQLAAAMARTSTPRKWTVYPGLQSNALFAADKKIPFEWIQPGNVGNTGGGSPATHGSETWTVKPGQPTDIEFAPANIAPKSDDFFNYSVLPYPSVPPEELFMSCRNFAAKSEADWANAQQLEGPQVEYIGGGFQNTCCWSASPTTGLHYWAGADKWQPFKPAGAPIMVDLGKPTPWMAFFTLDHVANTFTYEWLVIGDTLYEVNITVEGVPAALARKEFSVAVQGDGKATAPAYGALLDGLTVGWR